MNSEKESQNINSASNKPEFDNTLSIDEFFRQLEAKEKDLDISSDLVIEVEETDIGTQDLSDFLQMDMSVAPNKPEPVGEIETFETSAPHLTDAPYSQTEISTLQNQIAQMENERVEMFEIARRRQNDFDNYKIRTERERGETFRNQLSNLATQMLPAIDNLNRALDSIDSKANGKDQEFQQFYEGIVLVSQQMNEILAEMGVQPINAIGEKFDPHFHEAVATEMNDELPSQTVTTELLRGYRIGDKVIRPSMVKVSVSANSGNLPQLTPLAENGSDDAE